LIYFALQKRSVFFSHQFSNIHLSSESNHLAAP
jgi:hypothetical protein